MLLAVAFGVDAADKLSVGTRMYLQGAGLVGDIKTPADVSRIASMKKAGKEELVQCFVLSDSKSESELRSMGARVHGKVGNVMLVTVPAGKLEALAQLQSVKSVDVANKMKAFTDTAASVTHVNKVWNGTASGLPANYDGTGVVVGVIDTGIDFTHPAFKDASGNLRIKAVYMPEATRGGVYPVVDGDTLQGRSYVTAAQIGNLTTDTESEDHGTHTTGTAAGSLVGKYCGMAPGSEIVVGACGGDLSTLNIASSALYIADYAKRAGKPCVISISLGSTLGPHDGTSAITMIYDEIVNRYGAVIVISAGNSGCDKMYVGKKVTTNSVEDHPSLATVVEPQDNFADTDFADSYHCISILDVWNNNPNAVSVQAVILDKQGKPVWKSAMLKGSASVNGSQFSSYFGYGSRITMVSGVEPNNRYHMQIQSLIEKKSSTEGQYHYAVLFYGQNGDLIEVRENFAENYTQLASMESDDYDFVAGSGMNSESDDVTGKRTISVGAWASRLHFPYGNATAAMQNGGFSEGDIAYFSSYGIDFSGTQHPCVAAPGHTVIAPVNHYSSDFGDRSCSQKVSQNGTDYYWGFMSGTSMSTPVTAGIVALWLQANNTLAVDDIKRIIKETANHDSFTDGDHKERFGAGKIDALAGLQYMSKNIASISTNLLSIDFGNASAKTEVEKTLTVRGNKLTADVKIALVDSNNVFSVEPAVVKLADLTAGAEVKVKFAPRKAGVYAGQLVLSSEGVRDLTVDLKAVGESAGIVMLPTDTAKVTANSFVAKWDDLDETEGASTYTLVVGKHGSPLLVTDADFSGMNSTAPTDISGALADSVPDFAGWQGNGVMSMSGTMLLNGTLTSGKLGGIGEAGKVSVVLKGKSYNAKAFGNASMTVSTSLGSSKVSFGRNDNEYTVVLDAAANDVLTFKQDKATSQFAWVKVYAGDVNSVQPADGSSDYRKVTGIDGDTCKVEGLSQGTAYDYMVRSVGKDGSASAWSNVSNVTLKTETSSEMSLAEIAATGTTGKLYKLTDSKLVAVYANDSIIFAKDDNGYAAKDTLKAGQTDFVKAMKLQDGDYDQSNWVKIEMPQGTKVDAAWVADLQKGKCSVISGVTGRLAEKENLTLEATAAPVRGNDTVYVPNTMIPANFIGTQTSSVNGKEYFFVKPKPFEIVTLTWAKWDEASHRFMQPERTDTTNHYGLDGGAYAMFGLAGGESWFVDGHTYQLRALVMAADVDYDVSMSYDRLILPLEAGVSKDLSGVEAVNAGKTVVGVTYYNVAGMAADKPFDGVNIVETRFSDGSRAVVKVLNR